jgi:RND superfamily putative drug exporter
LGRLTVIYRWHIVAVWIVVVIAALPLAPTIGKYLRPGGFTSPGLESVRAIQQMQQAFGESPTTLLAVLTRPNGAITDAPSIVEIDRIAARLRDLPNVRRVVTPIDNPRQQSADGRVGYVTISVRELPDEFRLLVPAIRERVSSVELDVTLTGAPIFYGDIQLVTERDLRRAELLSFPFAGIALLLVFRTVVGALLPAMVGGVAVAATLGVMVLLSAVTELSIFALNLVSMLGLGLGIDYSLFIVSRFRDELRGSDIRIAVERSMDTAGRAVTFSGGTVLVGLLGLTLLEFPALRSLGIAGSIVVGMAVLAATTLLPAVLAILGPNVDRWRVLPPSTGRGGMWLWIADRVMARPIPIFALTLAALVTLGSPFTRATFGAPDSSILPDDVESRRGVAIIRDAFGEGEILPTLVVVSSPTSVFSPANVDALDQFARRLRAAPHVRRVESIVSIDERISAELHRLLLADPADIRDAYARAVVGELARDRLTVIRVVTDVGQTSPEARALVRSIRASTIGGDLTFVVGGGTAATMDYADGLFGQFPRTILFVIFTTFVLLLVLFRSIVIPLKALVMNTLSIVASFGALVLVFQEGWLAWLIGVRPLGFIEASLPVVMFCVLFGLSMDYEVFLLSRIREANDTGMSNRLSVAHGLESSGRLITSAAAIIVLVSFSFVAADIVLIKALGLGTAIAVFLDATIVRALLVPATMQMLGERNWWCPRWLDRALGNRVRVVH